MYTNLGLLFSLLMGLLAGSCAVEQRAISLLPTASTAVGQAAPSDSPLPTPGRRPRPTPAIFTMPELPPIAWSSPPPCALHPLSLAEWRQRHTREQADAPSRARLPLQRARQMSPFLAGLGNVDQLSARLLEEVGEDAEKGLRQAQLALWLNVTSGRLNRASEIQVAELPDLKTVHDLLDLLEAPTGDEGKSDALRQAIHSVLMGEAITNPVCANMLALHVGSDLLSGLWNGDGISKEPQALSKINEQGWIVSGDFQLSPDQQKIAIESFRRESGGPVFLYDLTTHTLTNLILSVGMTLGAEQDQTNTETAQNVPWQVIGWHPDSQHLLLGNDGASVFWVDIRQQTYERIDLNSDKADVITNGSYTDLLPDGSGFIYVSTQLAECSVN